MTFLASILLTAWVAATGSLTDDLKSYFQSENAAQRTKLAKRITSDATVTDHDLIKVIAELNLWEPQTPGMQEINLRVGTRDDLVKRTVVSIPTDYDPARPWPLVITLHGQGQSAASMMQMTRAILGPAADTHIVAAPQDLGPLGFTEPNDVVDQPRRLLYALRRQFHIDNDRVFLMGYSIGGHNTWMAAVMHADCFAGIMPLATPLQLIGNDALYGELMPNLRNLDTLFVWGAQDNLGQDGKPHPQGGNAEFSRRQAKATRDACGKRFVGVELPDAHHGNVRPPADDVKRWLSCKREAWPRRLHQQFRLPEQSRGAWVQAIDLMGKPLADAPSTVKLKPGEDQQAAQKRHLVAQLGLIEATVDQQTITINTKKVKNVELLLSDTLIDLDKPITIIRNKRQVFSGRINRNRDVILRETGETWDFARIPQARVVIPASGKKVTFGYTAKSK